MQRGPQRQALESLLRPPRHPHRRRGPTPTPVTLESPLNLACRAAEPDDADADAPLHAPDERLLQEGRVPPVCRGAPLHVLHLLPPPSDLTKAAGGIKTTPAMAAGLASRPWTIEDVLSCAFPDGPGTESVTNELTHHHFPKPVAGECSE
jgi:hypothetical protein